MDIDDYIAEAIQGAAAALLWQASDASEDGGNGFPTEDGETQFTDRVIAEVPYLTEAVTAFVTDNRALLERGGVTAKQAGHDIILTANGHGAGFWDRGLNMPATDDAGSQSVGDALTAATKAYSFDAEFALDEDGNVTWLMVENTVLVDQLGWSAGSPDEPAGQDAS
jgi:hypothetical protein